MKAFETRPSPRLVCGPGKLAELGDVARSVGGSHVLLVTDSGIVAAGHVARATEVLAQAGLDVTVYEGTHENPTEAMRTVLRINGWPLAGSTSSGNSRRTSVISFPRSPQPM